MFRIESRKVLKNNKTLFYDQKYSLNKNDLKKISKKNINNFVNKKFKGLTDRDAKYSTIKNFFNNRILNDMFPEKKRLTILFCPHVFSIVVQRPENLFLEIFLIFILKQLINVKKLTT